MALPHVHTSLGNVRPQTLEVAEEICNKWDLYFVWGIGATGEHAEGRALDFMVFSDGTVKAPGPMRPEVGRQIADYLVANYKRLGVWYVIHQRKIWSITYLADGWKPYHGDNPHIDHVHVSFVNDPPAYESPVASSNKDNDLTPEQAKLLTQIAADVKKNQERYSDLLKTIQTWGARNQREADEIQALINKAGE